MVRAPVKSVPVVLAVSEAAEYAPISGVLGVLRAGHWHVMNGWTFSAMFGSCFPHAGAFLPAKG
jgi:hypothetical protein